MKKFTLTIISLLLVGMFKASTAWAQQESFGGGDGTATNPYLISTADHWNQLASDVSAGTSYSGKYFQLAANISVSTLIGTGTNGNNAKSFSGTFDGNGNTLTFNYTATDDVANAPFRFLNNATIKNLHVDGTITTSYRHASGLAGRTYGTTLIQGCRVSTVIRSSVAGDATHGGIVVMKPDWKNAHLTLEGCVFDGKIVSTGTTASTHCGGLVGYTSYGSLTLSNCIYAPADDANLVTSERSLYRFLASGPGTITVNNCYYTQTLGDPQGKQLRSITVPTGITIVPMGDATLYSTSGITAYDRNMCLKYGDVLYAGKDDEATFTFTHNYTNSYVNYSVAEGISFTADENDVYTLIMPDENVEILANFISPETEDEDIRGEGTASSPYIINNEQNWNEVVELINDDEGFFASAYYLLNADITVTTMMGTDNYFKGHFDGNGKTLTLNYGADGNPFNEEYCAPFCNIYNAEIHDLKVEGAIYTSKKFAAGIAGYASGTNHIFNCLSNVTINSSVNGDGTHAGLVANIQSGSTKFTNCAFIGSMNGSSTDSWGGFVGWNEDAYVGFDQCLFYPSSLNVNNSGSATFSRYKNINSINLAECYYISTLGEIQGEQAYITDDVSTSVPLVRMTIAGISIYVEVNTISEVTASEITPTSAKISWNDLEESSSFPVSYQVRYREKELYSTSFENIEEFLNNWRTIDADRDGDDWYLSDVYPHTGNIYVISHSYTISDGALDPDNWLISPQLTIGPKFTVWISGQSETWTDNFEIYLDLSEEGKFIDENNKPLSSLIVLLPKSSTTVDYVEYSIDLTSDALRSYIGQKGYVGIRHYDSYDQLCMAVDDFGFSDDNGTHFPWTTIDNVSSGYTITGLTPNKEYEYQVACTIGDKTIYSSIGTLTTLDYKIAPFDINVTNVTSNSATIDWTAYADSYNLRYSPFTTGMARVTLNVPYDIWEDGSGYQMLLDADANTYGTIIPEESQLTPSGDASDELYSEFEYKIPTNADGSLTTANIIRTGSITIEIPAGIYDYFITNPTPGSRIFIASKNGNIGGRANDFEFEVGKHYTFTVSFGTNGEQVDLTVDVIEDENADWTTVENIEDTSYTLTGLQPSTLYILQLQSVKDGVSEWSGTLFTTAEATSIDLLDDADNNAVIEANDNNECNVTLVNRTLWKDGSWNTLCLPFAVDDFTGTPLDGAMVKELESASLSGSTLTLNFDEATSIEAGTPYLVKWTSDASYVPYDGTNADACSDIVNPTFEGVTVYNATNDVSFTLGDDMSITFVGTYSPVSFEAEDHSVLYLGGDDKFYYPQAGAYIGAQRAYFMLDGLTAGEPSVVNGIKAFVLNFGDEETGIREITTPSNLSNSYYSLDGRRLNSKPTAKGLYIHNGRKVIF